MNKKNIALWPLLAALTAGAQPYTPEQWDAKPVVQKPAADFNKESAVYLLDKRRIEFAIEKDGLACYYTLHKIIYVNDDKGIETFNKIYLPVRENSDLLDVKARGVQPDGSFKELNRNNIKDYKDEEGNAYKIFAVEGLTKGSMVEYFYTFKRGPQFFGQETFQSRLPVQKAVFMLASPDHLVYEARPYNNFGKVRDTTVAGKNFLYYTDENVAGVEEEKYTMYRAALKRVEYKLSYNKGRSENERLFSWSELAKSIYKRITTLSKSEQKKLDDLVDDMKIPAAADEKGKIRHIENYLKQNFMPEENYDAEDAEDLAATIKKKVTDHTGMLKLFCAVLEKAGIRHTIVLAADREDSRIDKNFENWNHADKYLIHFPGINQYLAPTATIFRMPWVPPTWVGSAAVFCKSTQLGDFKTAIAEVKATGMEGFEKTQHNHDMSLQLNKGMDTLLVDMKVTYMGYDMAYYRAPFAIGDAEQQRSALKESVRSCTKSENIVTSNFVNKEFNADPEKPFVMEAKVNSPQLVERAGNKILIKVGELIGPQVEMYDEKPRQLPVEIQYPHILARTITLQLPEGYLVKNLKDANFNITDETGGNMTMGFVAAYKEEGNKVIITVREDYRVLNYPMNQYELFKKVVNAAADFNKVVLVLEKK
jgi:hypothetical protein